MKRIIYFIVSNILILTMITIIVNVFGLEIYLEEGGLNLTALLIFSAIIGFGGAFLSLGISKWMAKTFMGVKVLPANGHLSPEARRLVDRVHVYAQRAGLDKMPEVGVYDSNEVNAFATGPSRNNSLVAVSAGMLNSMDADSVDGVLAHEVAHIANGDMVTMTLLQGIVNTFVIFLARVAAWIVARFINEDLGYFAQFILIMAFQIFFSILGGLVVMAFSRHREYKADEWAATYAGKHKMIGALQSLKFNSQAISKDQPALQTLKISGGKQGLLKLWASHPDLDDRIAALQKL
jgi:heat shock protein HtpX